MRRTIVLLTTIALTLLVASGVVLAAGIGSAGTQSSVVGPGESIQKAVNAAHPGDTIVVRGVHREDVVIRKDGIKLRGDDAVIEAPPRAKADSPCLRLVGPEAICVWGDFDINTGKLTGPRVSDVSVSGFTIRGFKIKGKGGDEAFVIDVYAARNATVVGNRVIGNVPGGSAFGKSVNTTIAKNHIVGSPKIVTKGITVGGGSRNTKVVNNVVRSYPEGTNAIDLEEAINTTVAGNDLIGNGLGVLAVDSTGTKILSNDITDTTSVGTVIFDSTGTKIVSNDISRYGDTGIVIFGPERANNDAKVVGNNISGGPAGIYVANAHRGSFAGNTIYDNCAGMFFEADGSNDPVSGFEVKANTVENNTRSCRGGNSTEAIRMSLGSGSGFSARRTWRLRATASRATSPPAPPPSRVGSWSRRTRSSAERRNSRNNSVIGNHFGRNKPDIFWDESGSANSFVATSATRVCPAVCVTREVLLLTRKAPLRRGFRLRFQDARQLVHRPRAEGRKVGGVGRPRGEPPLQVQERDSIHRVAGNRPPRRSAASVTTSATRSAAGRPSCLYSPECVE